MRLDDACAVGGGERRGRLGRRCASVAPGGEQIQEPWGCLTQEGARIGAAIPQHLRGGFVDEPHAILGVDHEDALAQVLHDVLRELGEVRKIDLLAAHQRLALAQAVRDRPGGERNGEQHHTDDAAGGEVARRRDPCDIDEHLLHENAERTHRGDEKGIAMLSEHRHCAHRQHEQNPKAARNAAAGIENERYPGRIDAGIEECDAPQARPGEPPCDHEQHPGREIGDAGREEGPRVAREELLPAQPLHGDQHRRQEQPVKIDEADHAPGEIAPDDGG